MSLFSAKSHWLFRYQHSLDNSISLLFSSRIWRLRKIIYADIVTYQGLSKEIDRKPKEPFETSNQSCQFQLVWNWNFIWKIIPKPWTLKILISNTIRRWMANPDRNSRKLRIQMGNLIKRENREAMLNCLVNIDSQIGKLWTNF